MRKVLSFVLVLTLVLSSFSMAFAADTTASGLSDIAGNANEDAIQVAYDLSIVTGNPDGTFLPEKAVTRAEFAAMITRALAIPDSALAGYTSTSFKDTVGYGWAVPYLAFCQSKGIMLGDGEGNVMPGRTITVNEAMTMAMRAIGYTANSSLLVGAWPANYVSIAQNEDLYDDVAADTTVNKASAAQIIYNMLTVQKVAVNTDGTTDYLWTDKNKDKQANLLNTNLGCEEKEGVVIGDAYTYDTSLINITKYIGAFGDAYENDDDDLVAFIPDSVALTGKIDGDKFKVGDTKYEFDDDGKDFTTSAITFFNADKDDSSVKLTKASIEAYAVGNTDNDKDLTIYADVSGKKIKDVYSAVAWKADQSEQADANVQDDIDDQELLSADFVTDDDDNIDMKSFQLVGVASLADIEEDDVVYVYVDSDDNIRKVAVGTETVEGVVDEIEEGSNGGATLTINGTEYDITGINVREVEYKDFDTDSEGTFYLDYSGKIFDFDGSSSVSTYGIIKGYDDDSEVSNWKVKLYTSEDSTKTYTFGDEIGDMSWTSEGAVETKAAIKNGNLIGYGLDSNGDIDEIDSTAVLFNQADVNIKSSKIITIDSKDYDIDKDAVVFTYDTGFLDPEDVVTRDDLESGAADGDVRVIFNDDKDVIALYVNKADASAEDDAIYGVINVRKSGKNSDGDAAYKYTGYIDGASYSYMTDDDTSAFKASAGTFSVYAFTLDSSDTITKIESMIDTGKKYVPDSDESGWLVRDFVIGSINSDKTTVTSADGKAKYGIDDDAVVYKYDADEEEFTVANLKKLQKDYTVTLIDAKGDDADGSASIVIYQEDK